MKKLFVTTAAVAIAGLAALACEQAARPLGPDGSDIGPMFDRQGNGPFGMTGGGQIRSPSGGSHHQVLGIEIKDKDLNGVPEGNLVFRDMNPANRVNNRQLMLRSVSWSSITAISGCADGGIEATGVLEITNTSQRHRFRLTACDNGEPGRGSDFFRLEVFRDDGSTRFSWSGTLVGGNLQAHGIAPSVPPPTTGDLRVITATTGASIPAGYMVSASGPGGSFGPAPIGATDTVTLSAITAGDYTVTLSQVPANCTVTTPPPNPRTVPVSAGMVTSTTFNVTCTAVPTTGDLRIITATTGASIPAGYMVSASGPGGSFGPAPIGATDTVTLSAIAAGDYTVTLSQVPANCTVTTPPPNPRTVPVPAGGVGSTTFNVTCTAVPTTGDLRIITATTGASIPAGYMVSASGPGGSFGPAPIGATDTV
ncbi:MAG TPA: post-COAP-1 domain-containing protein, partial [Actinoplanes sp.]|nr:post-COAP-1 domain-containing protein [Actinoplanes sp.]